MKIAALIVGIALAGVSLPGCACWTQDAQKNTTGCIVAHDVVDCTTSGIVSVLPYFASIVGRLISGGVSPKNIPWSDIVAQAEAMGIKDGGCFLAELKNLLFPTGEPTASPELMIMRQSLEDALVSYKMKHFGNNQVKFKIKDKSGREVLL